MGRKNKRKKASSSGKKVLKGVIEVTRSGLGYVIVEGLSKDVLVKREHIGNALDGDTVRVEINPRAKKFGSRPEGIVTDVLKRKQTEFGGRLEVHKHFAFLIPDNDKMPVDIFVPIDLLNGASDGDKCIVKIVEWTGKTKNPVGEVVSVLSNETPNEIEMQGILVESGFPLTFEDDTLEIAARFPDVLDEKEIKERRRDMREELTFTIDPLDAKDFDDALSIKTLKGGYYEVGVHIADVSYYVEAGSALDNEAYRRATSVYLPDRVSPMLPERLSNELCSLRPDEDKYAFSAVFKINKKGVVKEYWLGRTAIRSKRRFTYEEAQEVIEGADNKYAKQILVLDEMAKNLRAQRFEKGAINFSSQEVRFKLDENAKPTGIVVKESKDAHKLIEEFMLLANRTVAHHVSQITVKDKPLPFPYRVHDEPNEEKLKLFAAFAAKYGHGFNMNTPEQIAHSFNEMLQLAHGKPEQHVLETLGIRTMAKAIYTTENVGHYGLGFDYYCHFTSPIRRYPDVLVHRILADVLDGNPQPIKQLEQMCRHCSDQERNAMEAERAANKYKQVEYMQAYVGGDFDAVVSGVAPFGFWAETVEHKCEGMVPIADLFEIDDFELQEEDYALVGQHTNIRFRIGDKVKIRVVATNLEKRQIDYTLVELLDTPKPKKSKSKSNTKNVRKKKK